MTRPPTSNAQETLHEGVRRVLFRQALVVLVVAAGFWLWQLGNQGFSAGLARGGFDALSALYGGAITLLNSWWLGRRVQQAGDLAREQPVRGQLALYAGAVQRFIGTLILLGIGLGWLKLAPIPLIVAFAAGQLGFLANPGGPTRVGMN